jgi:uncharacterized RDD family membrane protein YckC
MPPDAPGYPRLLHRAVAASWDSLFMVYGAMFALIVGDALGIRSNEAKLALMLAPFFIVDPLMVSLTGATPGHRLYNLHVCRARDGRRIGLPAALLRFLVKFLGSSLVWLPVLVTRRHQALHDLLAGSLVQHRDPARVRAQDNRPERLPDTTHIYPPGWRRVLLIVAYSIAASLLLDGIGGALFGADCWDNMRCTAPGALGVLFGNIVYLLLLGVIVVRGWGGRLPGARRRPAA